MKLTPEEMNQVMNVNVIAYAFCTQLSIKLMIKKGIDDGQIIFNNRYKSSHIQKGKIIQGELYNIILQKCVLSSARYVSA